MAKTLEERLWHRVDIRKPEECWPWRGNVGNGGYGRISVVIDGKQKLRAAHRLAWEFTNGELLGKQIARHTCDNPSCCNPAHIRPGTQAQNMGDAMRRGRLSPSRGEWNPNARLTDEKVLALREDRAEGMTLSALSEKYEVSPPVVANVYRGHTWKHVGGPIQKDPTVPAHKLDPFEEEQLVQKYASGVLAGKICKEFNIARGTMVNVLERHGVARRSPGRPPKLTAQDVVQVRKTYTQRRISMQLLADQFGVSLAAIHRTIRGPYAPKHGID